MSHAGSHQDVIVVGSGASGVNAAWPLVERGLRVTLVDVGFRDETYASRIPPASFEELRRTDAQQHEYLLGDRFEGIPFGGVRVGAQLTPPRAFVNRDVAELTPVESTTFHGMESLARGGLASAWGAGVARFTADDLAGAPIGPADLAPHYAAVERRIGISGRDDDLTPELGLHEAMMPPLAIDGGARALLDSYSQRRERCLRAGLRMGITRLAACAEKRGDRGPHPLDDLDFWSDRARAVYRPRWTLEALRTRSNFTYRPGLLALRFTESGSAVTLTSQRLEGGEEHHTARALVLAAGVFGTARIVLRSLGLYDHAVPYVCNPYTYAPCIQPRMIGRAPVSARHSLSQLTATFSPPESDWPQTHVSLYSYRSLLTFKLVKESPLSARTGLHVMRSLIPLLTILGVHHADAPVPGKELALVSDARGERLVVTHRDDAATAARIDRQEAMLFRTMRTLGCHPLKRIRPGAGSSIHYAGTFPMSREPAPLRTASNGLLHGTSAVYLADGSLLERLPAKGLTLTLMANADRVGSTLAERL